LLSCPVGAPRHVPFRTFQTIAQWPSRTPPLPSDNAFHRFFRSGTFLWFLSRGFSQFRLLTRPAPTAAFVFFFFFLFRVLRHPLLAAVPFLKSPLFPGKDAGSRSSPLILHSPHLLPLLSRLSSVTPRSECFSLCPEVGPVVFFTPSLNPHCLLYTARLPFPLPSFCAPFRRNRPVFFLFPSSGPIFLFCPCIFLLP